MVSLADLSSALGIIESEGPSRGLFLNRFKCLLYSPLGTPDDNPLPADIFVSSCGFDLLGSPISPPLYCEEPLLQRIDKVRSIIVKLSDLQDSQMES